MREKSLKSENKKVTITFFMFLFRGGNRLPYNIDLGATDFYWTQNELHSLLLWCLLDFKKLPAAICFHYKEKAAQIFCQISSFVASTHTGLKQHEEIMTTFIFWWTIHTNVKNLYLKNQIQTIKLHYGVSECCLVVKDTD